MTCEKCGHVYCYTHGDQHINSNCADYERKHRRENLVNQALIAKITKPCPKCKSAIQKRSGCNHMKCPQCHASFCWLCGMEVEDKPFPDHFKETNLTSGCRGKQFGQNEGANCFSAVIFIGLLLIIGPPAGVLSLVTYILTLPCLSCCLQEHTLAAYTGAFRFIFNMYATFIVYLFFLVIGLAFIPCCCVFCCYRSLGGTWGLNPEGPMDEDDRMARQLEEEAAREVASVLGREEVKEGKTVDEIV